MLDSVELPCKKLHTSRSWRVLSFQARNCTQGEAWAYLTFMLETEVKKHWQNAQLGVAKLFVDFDGEILDKISRQYTSMHTP